MWIRLLKLCARRPLTALSVVLVLVVSAIVTPIALLTRGDHRADGKYVVVTLDQGAAASPRQLIGRIWLDKFPSNNRDEVDLLLFFGSGFGIYEHGSRFKATMEFFEFERSGDKVEMTFFQDKEKKKTKFTVKPCSDNPKFDLCVDFENALRGPKRYYSWDYDDEDAARIPWARDFKRAAEERAKEARSGD